MTAIGGWAAAFAFTQAIEVPIYVCALRRGRVPGPLPRHVALAFGASALTHPVVWFVMPALADASFQGMANHGLRGLVALATFRWLAFGLLAEGFAVAVEAAYLRAFRLPHAFAWAFLANLISASAGYLCFRVTGWP